MAALTAHKLALLDTYLYQARYFTESLIGLQMDATDHEFVDERHQERLETDLRRTLAQIRQLIEEDVCSTA